MMALLVSNSSVSSSPLLRLRSHVVVRSLSSGNRVTVPPIESVRINEATSVNRKYSDVDSYKDGGKLKGQNGHRELLEPLWDDGYGTQSLQDYIDIALSMIKNDGGPPRWFCPVACGKPLQDSPVLLYIPGRWCSVTTYLFLKQTYVIS